MGARHLFSGTFLRVMLAQRGAMLGWVPVCLSVGIGCYFSLVWEPSLMVFAGAGAGALALCGLAWRLPEALSPFAIGILLILIGFSLAGLRAHLVTEPVLEWRYYGAVEGRVVAMDRSQSDA